MFKSLSVDHSHVKVGNNSTTKRFWQRVRLQNTRHEGANTVTDPPPPPPPPLLPIMAGRSFLKRAPNHAPNHKPPIQFQMLSMVLYFFLFGSRHIMVEIGARLKNDPLAIIRNKRVVVGGGGVRHRTSADMNYKSLGKDKTTTAHHLSWTTRTLVAVAQW